jgi:hypothetical protein
MNIPHRLCAGVSAVALLLMALSAFAEELP